MIEALFFTSKWSTLDLAKILEADDSIAQDLNHAVDFEDKLRLISGWHYEFFISHKGSFPTLGTFLEEFGCLEIDDVHSLSRLSVRRAWAGLSKSAQNVLESEIDHLVRLPVFHSSRGMLPAPIDEKVEANLVHSTHVKESSRKKSLIQQFFLRLENQKERVREIIESRLGIKGEPLTLDQTGQIHNVTRERIRQLEKKFWIRTEQGELWDDYLRANLEIQINNLNSPISLEDLESSDDWYKGISNRKRIFNEILRRLTNNSFFLVSINEKSYVYNKDQDFVDDQIRIYVSERSSGNSIEQATENLDSTLQGMTQVFEDIFSKFSFEFTHPFTGERIKVSGRPFISSVVKSFTDNVLEAFTLDQFLVVCIEIGLDTSEHLRTIKNALLKDFQLLGNGGNTYISENAIKNLIPDYKNVCERVYGLVSKKRLDRIWHLDEISPWLIRVGIIPDKVPDNAWVLACLKFDPMKRFKIKRSMFWVIESGIEVPPNLDSQVIDILKQSNQAMSTQEIKLSLSEIRGVGKTFQIHPSPSKGIHCTSPGRFIYIEPTG